MKLKLTLTAVVVLANASLLAQTADDLNEGIRLTHDASQTLPYSLKWFARDGFYYFILESEDLKTWVFYPYGVVGTGGVEGIDYDSNAERKFFKLLGCNDESLPPYVLDFDNDGISNGDELLSSVLDPFVAETIVDGDNDGLPDYWEEFYFGSGNLSKDGSADTDGDGILDKFEWQGRSNPTSDDAQNPSLRDNFTYDDRGWLAAYKMALSQSFEYTFDVEGNILSKD